LAILCHDFALHYLLQTGIIRKLRPSLWLFDEFVDSNVIIDQIKENRCYGRISLVIIYGVSSLLSMSQSSESACHLSKQ
jgi:hypothetical protein